MPNHIHFLLKQLTDDGVSTYMSKLSNSHKRYINTKNERNGHLFQSKFKSIYIENDSQLVHVSRYIHLNPYTSHIVHVLGELKDYQFSSLQEYLGSRESRHFSKRIILDQFKSKSEYKKFVFNRADYQRELHSIKHLTFDG
jgi:putative transposase